MKVLITGGNGFIGTCLRHSIHSSYNPGLVRYLTRDMTGQEIEDIQPTHVFHLAANPIVKDDSYRVSESNIVLTHKLLDHILPDCRFIFTSSATVVLHNTNPSVYSWSKKACEELISIKHKNSLIFRLVAQVGPYATHGVVHDIVRKLRSSEENLNLLTNSTKPYMHVQDTVDFILQHSFSKSTGIINLAPKDTISIKDMAEIIMSELSIYKKIVWSNKSWPGDSMNVEINSEFSGQIRSSKEAISEYVRTIK